MINLDKAKLIIHAGLSGKENSFNQGWSIYSGAHWIFRAFFPLTHEFEVLLINLTIHLPPPFNGVQYLHYCGIPDLNFDFKADRWNINIKISKEVAEYYVVRDSEYEIDNEDAEESVKNFIRNIRLKSILD